MQLPVSLTEGSTKTEPQVSGGLLQYLVSLGPRVRYYISHFTHGLKVFQKSC